MIRGMGRLLRFMLDSVLETDEIVRRPTYSAAPIAMCSVNTARSLPAENPESLARAS